ncbi:MAG: endonuclease/exonuclease/phosphatase family protein, partial [Blastocatellia bacterium]|nr:endonuclease/exonuclease/phosphatase family protein [Blastocatellia bacterium]
MTLVPILQATAWWIRIFDFPRLQIVAVGFALLAIFIPVYGMTNALDATFVVLLAVSIGYQIYMIYPYTRLAHVQVEYRHESDNDRTLAVLFANVLMHNRQAEDLLIQVRAADPDLILLAETDAWWQQQADILEADYPYTVKYPQDNTYGLLLYSRLELIEPEIKFLIQDDVPSFHGRVRLRSGDDVELRCLHPRPPVPMEDPSSAPRDAEILIVGKENRKDNLPFVVFGDLNDVAWSRTNYLFQNISGLLDPRVGRGFYHTFHAKIPLLRFPLDHLFHSNHFRLVDFQRLGYFGSDHFPVFIKLSLE